MTTSEMLSLLPAAYIGSMAMGLAFRGVRMFLNRVYNLI